MTEFIIEEGIEAFLLIYVILFVASFIRACFDIHKIKDRLGYGLAVVIGSVTPFCFCAAIPLFVAFIDAGIPLGVAMTFLAASSLINETAMGLILVNKAWAAAAIYFVFGGLFAIILGRLCAGLKIKPCAQEHICDCPHCTGSKSKLRYAFDYTHKTIRSIGPFVLMGLIFAALMHEFVPQEFFTKYLGGQNPFSVGIAATAGIFIYADHDGILPVVRELIDKGIPLGTAIVMMMSIKAISLPKIIVIGKILGAKLTTALVLYLFLTFIVIGYLLNAAA